jgi:hypothetical protein
VYAGAPAAIAALERSVQAVVAGLIKVQALVDLKARAGTIRETLRPLPRSTRDTRARICGKQHKATNTVLLNSCRSTGKHSHRRRQNQSWNSRRSRYSGNGSGEAFHPLTGEPVDPFTISD